MATYYVDVTSGDDGDTGLSEVLAWQNLHHAGDNVVAGDTIHVKGSAPYVVEDGSNDCVLQITMAGGIVTPINWKAYTSTPGDGGIVTINALTNTLASAVKTAIGGAVYNTFEGFRFTGGSADGFDANGNTDDGIISGIVSLITIPGGVSMVMIQPTFSNVK